MRQNMIAIRSTVVQEQLVLVARAIGTGGG